MPSSLATGSGLLAAAVDTYSDGSSPVQKGFGRMVLPHFPRAASSSKLHRFIAHYISIPCPTDDYPLAELAEGCWF